MKRTKEEEDLALALALSQSISPSSHDEQCLAFFSDLPLPSSSRNNATPSGQQRTQEGDDYAYARRLQEVEESTSGQYAKDIVLAREMLTQDKNIQNVSLRDFAYARRLQEDEKKHSRASEMDRELQYEKDMQLAKELQEEGQQLHSSSTPPHNSVTIAEAKTTRGRPPVHVSGTYSIGDSRVCSYCRKSFSGGGRYLTVERQLKLHPECFLCAGCGQSIQQSYVKRGDVPDIEFYHGACNQALFSPDCDLCGDKLTGYYKTNGFFKDKQKFCASHVGSELRSCCSCHLLEPIQNNKEKFNTLPDGRAICPDCVTLIILETDEARNLYLDAVHFMDHVLGLSIPPYMRQVPVLAVDLPSLNDQNALNRHLCPSHSPVLLSDLATSAAPRNTPTGFSSAVTRGLTISTTKSVRHMTPGALSWSSLTKSWSNLAAPPLITLQYHTSVTAVLVLCGLPEPLTASILAHEAMHVWFRLHPTRQQQGDTALPPRLEEGVCQLISFLYIQHLQSQARSSSTNSWTDRLLPYYLCQIETDPSPVYGDGFREAAAIHAAVGLQPMLDHIVATGQLPVI